MVQRKQAGTVEGKPARGGRKKGKSPKGLGKQASEKRPAVSTEYSTNDMGDSATSTSTSAAAADDSPSNSANCVPSDTQSAERLTSTNGHANGEASSNGHANGPTLKAPISFDRVVAEQLEWHWYPYLPAGQLVMLSGFPAVGKSTFLAAVAAQISGGPMIEGERRRGPGKVLHYATEQQAGSMTRPKLEAAKAILRNVIAGDIADDHSKRPRLAFPGDFARLEDEIRTYRAQAVIFDPVTSYFGDGVNVKDSQHIRPILDSLALIASRNGCLIICTMHYRKSLDGGALQRLSGSSAFGEVAQTVISLDKVTDPDERRIISLTKHNLTADGPSRLFTLEDDSGRPVFRLGPAVEVSADDLMSAPDSPAERDALADCIRWLKSEIDEGVVATNDLKQRSDKAGHSWATVKRAKTKLRITAGRVGNSKGAYATFIPPKNGWSE